MTSLREVAVKYRREGPRGVARRAVRRASRWLDADALDFPLTPELVADSAVVRTPRSSRPAPATPLRIGWLMTPPSAGSGGHTTALRMVEFMESVGHHCTILLYDRHHGDVGAHESVLRRGWSKVRANVRSVDDGFRGLDAVVATAWPTAHVLAALAPDVHRFYFIQDYEPFFYPRGSEAALAADSYRFGFTNIALGEMVTRRLRSELGIESHTVPFSCDTHVYQHRNHGDRNGVVFYVKQGVARRGFRLAVAALAEFHRSYPDQQIHCFGERVDDLPFPAVQHGGLAPAELDELYNSCIAGLALSFTNISLVAEEMLASGCVAVVNDSVDARADLDHPSVRWVPPTGHGLALGLGQCVEAHQAGSGSVIAPVRTDNWSIPAMAVTRILEEGVRGRAPSEG